MLDFKVMLNAINAELNKKGRASRLLPSTVANTLRATLTDNGYTANGNTLVRANTNIEFVPAGKYVRVLLNRKP